MNDRDFFLVRRKAEFPAFQRVLNALPADKMDYKPHERSPAASQLAWLLAAELGCANTLCDTGETTFPTAPAPDLAGIIAAFEKNYAGLEDRVRKMDEAAWTKPGTLKSGGKVMMETPVGEFLWMLFFDAIHHRGQLSAYIRPMGGRVPAIYGPSGDSKQ